MFQSEPVDPEHAHHAKCVNFANPVLPPHPSPPATCAACGRGMLQPPCIHPANPLTLNHMVHYLAPSLDLSFAALSDATRRGVLEQLARAEASITSLADRFQMTLTGMKKHVAVLERAGLVATEKVGRVRMCKLGQRDLAAEAEWIAAWHDRFAARFDALDRVLAEIQQEEDDHGRTD